jgi:hypothetical protein
MQLMEPTTIDTMDLKNRLVMLAKLFNHKIELLCSWKTRELSVT